MKMLGYILGCYMKEKQPFSDDFTWFCQAELSRTIVKAALPDESYAWVPESQDFAKVKGPGFSTKTEKKAVSQEITLIEVGFLSYSV